MNAAEMTRLVNGAPEWTRRIGRALVLLIIGATALAAAAVSPLFALLSLFVPTSDED